MSPHHKICASVLLVAFTYQCLLPAAALLIEEKTDEGSSVTYNFTGTCAIKAWLSVAECRKEFTDRLVNKDDIGKCCLYFILDACAHRGAAKLCGNATDQVKEQYMRKYALMIGNPDCSDVSLHSWTCFWISWENYVSSFIFFLITMVMIVFVVRWYARQAIRDDPDYNKM